MTAHFEEAFPKITFTQLIRDYRAWDHYTVAWWGERLVHLKKNGEDYTVSADYMANYVRRLVHRNFHFDETERAAGRKLVERINGLYECFEADLKEASGFTNWCRRMRDYWYEEVKIKEKWDSYTSKVFTLYTKVQLELEKEPGNPVMTEGSIKYYSPKSVH